MSHHVKLSAILVVVIVIGLLLFALTRFGATVARNVIYQPPPNVAAVTLDGLPTGGGVVSVKTGDGLTLKGLAFRGNGQGDMFLIFHGNASTAHYTAQWLHELVEEGHSVIFAEYRGYAGNPGEPSEKGTAFDADAWSKLAFQIAKKEHGNQRVFYIGHSLGGGVAFQAAQQRSPHALITISTFTDTPSLAPSMAQSLVADRYNNKAKIAGLKSDYYILHGTADTVIPVSHGWTLIDAARKAGLWGGAFILRGEEHDPDATKIIQAINYITETEMDPNIKLPIWSGVDLMRFRAGEKPAS